LLPQIHADEIKLRSRYLGINYLKKYPNANPDALIDGHFVEFKEATLYTLGKRIAKASKQDTVPKSV